MKTGRFAGILPFLLFLTVYIAALAFFGVNRPLPWGDEAHFHETILQFAANPTLETLRTYNEMSTPLPFVVYALWGKAFGLGLPALRIFSLLVSTITLSLGYWLFRLLLPRWLATVSAVLLAFNPYFAGTSVFVFTDMLAVTFLLFGCLSLVKGSGVGLFLSCAGALLSRQYLVFFPLAVILYSAMEYFFSRNAASLKNIFCTLLSFLPFVMLALFWGGFSPDCQRRVNYLSLGWDWRPQSFFLYVALLFAYVLPFSAVLLYRRRGEIKRYWPVLPLSFLYWLFPVQPSPFTRTETDFVTVGMLHRFVIRFFSTLVTEAFFYLFFLLGALILCICCYRLTAHLKSKQAGIEDFLIIAHILFLTIMPVSYLWWEKYFLPLLPLSLLLALLALDINLSKTAKDQKGSIRRIPV